MDIKPCDSGEARIDDSIKACQQSDSGQYANQQVMVYVKVKQPAAAVEKPAKERSQDKEIENADPSCRGGIEDANQGVRVAKSEKRGWYEADGQEGCG